MRNINILRFKLEVLALENFNSFCALSSIINKESDVGKYKGHLRPTCYPMICGKQSLTIQIGEEYIVCPRKGGMIKIENKRYTNYTGYLFCPDYNLICTGTEICNNLFDCIEKKSIPKESKYNYDDINFSIFKWNSPN